MAGIPMLYRDGVRFVRNLKRDGYRDDGPISLEKDFSMTVRPLGTIRFPAGTAVIANVRIRNGKKQVDYYIDSDEHNGIKITRQGSSYYVHFPSDQKPYGSMRRPPISRNPGP